MFVCTPLPHTDGCFGKYSGHEPNGSEIQEWGKGEGENEKGNNFFSQSSCCEEMNFSFWEVFKKRLNAFAYWG